MKVVQNHAEIIPLPENLAQPFCGVFREGSSLTRTLLKTRKKEGGIEEKSTARFLRTSGISKKEDNYRKVMELLNSAPDGWSITWSTVMNEINAGESYYIIARERGIKQADYFIETILPDPPIEIISNSFNQIIDASRIRVNHPVSYADCFVVATAIGEKAKIVIGDPDFKRFRDIGDIEWI